MHDASTVPTRLGYEPEDIISRLDRLTSEVPEPFLEDVARAICNDYDKADPKTLATVLASALQKVKAHETVSAQGRMRSIIAHMDNQTSNHKALESCARTLCGTFYTPSGAMLAKCVKNLLGGESMRR